MRHGFILLLFALLFSGCASHKPLSREDLQGVAEYRLVVSGQPKLANVEKFKSSSSYNPSSTAGGGFAAGAVAGLVVGVIEYAHAKTAENEAKIIADQLPSDFNPYGSIQEKIVRELADKAKLDIVEYYDERTSIIYDENDENNITLVRNDGTKVPYEKPKGRVGAIYLKFDHAVTASNQAFHLSANIEITVPENEIQTTIYRNNYIFQQVVDEPYQKDLIELWAKNDAQLYRQSFTEGLNEIIKALTLDISFNQQELAIENLPQQEAQLVKAMLVYPNDSSRHGPHSIEGQEIAKSDERIIFRNNNGDIYSLQNDSVDRLRRPKLTNEDSF